MLSTKDVNELKKDITFKDELHGISLTFHTTWGLFNPTYIDEGTKLLADVIDVADDADCLDLGCGYGALGLTLARLCPKGSVHMVDKDFVAVEYAKKNANANGISNATIYLSNGFSHVPADAKFDLIVSNLPAKVGKELLYIMMMDAKDHLNPGGKFVVVTISGLKEYIKRQFKDVFGNYKKVKQVKTYIVSLAVNE